MRIELQGNIENEAWRYTFIVNALQNANVKCSDIVVKLDDSLDMTLTVDGKEDAYVICMDSDPIDYCKDGSEVYIYTVYERYGVKADDRKNIYLGFWNTGGGDEVDKEFDDFILE